MFRTICFALLCLQVAWCHLGRRIHHSWANAGPGVSGTLYGIMTTNLPMYQDKLRAQLQTWASHLPNDGRLVVVSGAGHGVPLDLEGATFLTSCNDDYSGVTCKEERLLELAYERQPDWFVILGEDNYVDVARLEKRLETLDTSVPKVYGILGCEMNRKFCPEAADRKSICGGGGYMLNRAAINEIMKGGRDALRDEYARGSGLQGDLTTTCILRRRDIDVVNLPGLVGARVMNKRNLKKLAASSPLTYHYLTPAAMRWLHALRSGSPTDEVDTLEQQAFNRGCCCWYDLQSKQKCQERYASAYSFLSTPGIAHTMAAEVMWEALRISYIDSVHRARVLNATSDAF
eukprot:TRINITY_DN28931_c0_g1_i1.p1 TRINITY_DN28931_c0_g1~~TRINITY_DN28931_c0_g1_i1.p1  ORF type:complete len:346 (-),score=29.90 TRINITY_DN28931_c0_g1_i1:165-1202(-)